MAGDFDETFNPGTLQVFVSKVQGERNEAVDYPANLQGYTGSQIDVLTPALPHQGTFDLYASALNGATRVYSNPVSVAYGPLVTEYDLDGAGNRGTVETSAETDVYASEDDAPPADAQMNQYTQTPGELAARAYDENGNLLRTGAALPALYKHDYLDRIVEMSGIPTLDSGSGVPVGNEFSDDFASGLDATWVNDPAFQGGLGSALWSWDSAGALKNPEGTASSVALPRTNPDGDFWWVYARPTGAAGDDVVTAHLRITGHDTDTQQAADFLKLDIDTDEISLWHDGTGGGLASAAIATADDTPYLIHAHLFGSTVIIRRGQLGQPLETVLTIGNAPIQATDRFILSTASACIVDNVNIGHFETQYAYDALGRRIEKRTAEGTTRYVYDGARVAEEWSLPEGGNPTLAASYVYGLYIDEVLTMRRGGSDYYYHGDDMHNVVKLTDSDGEVVEAYDYGDYGQPEFYDENGVRLEVSVSQFGNPCLFAGREWDAELAYYYFRNRYMDPGLGRFASRDPLGLWGDPLNLGNGYTYAASNPWSLVDPFGLECENPGNQQRKDYTKHGFWGHIGEGFTQLWDDIFGGSEEEPESYELQPEDFETDTEYYLYRQSLLGEPLEGVVERDYYAQSKKPEDISQAQIWDAANAKAGEQEKELGKKVTKESVTAIITGVIVRKATGARVVPEQAEGSYVKHHIFNVFRGSSPRSQKYREFFFKHGINVDDYTVAMPAEFHRAWVHRAGNNWTTA